MISSLHARAHASCSLQAVLSDPPSAASSNPLLLSYILSSHCSCCRMSCLSCHACTTGLLANVPCSASLCCAHSFGTTAWLACPLLTLQAASRFAEESCRQAGMPDGQQAHSRAAFAQPSCQQPLEHATTVLVGAVLLHQNISNKLVCVRQVLLPLGALLYPAADGAAPPHPPSLARPCSSPTVDMPSAAATAAGTAAANDGGRNVWPSQTSWLRRITESFQILDASTSMLPASSASSILKTCASCHASCCVGGRASVAS